MTEEPRAHESDNERYWDADGYLLGPYCVKCFEPWPCFAFGLAHPDEAVIEARLIAAHPYPGEIR